MKLFEIESVGNDLILLLRTLVSKANGQQQTGPMSWRAFNSLMGNVGDAQFDYESFKNIIDTNPELKNAVMQKIKRYDARGIELKTEVDTPNRSQDGSDASTNIANMAKAATNKRMG
jgi:hypothetical protein